MAVRSQWRDIVGILRVLGDALEVDYLQTMAVNLEFRRDGGERKIRSSPSGAPTSLSVRHIGPLHHWSASLLRISPGFESRPQRSTGVVEITTKSACCPWSDAGFERRDEGSEAPPHRGRPAVCRTCSRPDQYRLVSFTAARSLKMTAA